MELNEYQIELIEQLLNPKQLKSAPLRSELLDHICCHVELLMAQGLDFEEAILKSLALFDEDEMKKLNQINHFSKRKIMSYSISAAVVVLGLFFGTGQATIAPKVIHQQPAILVATDPPSKIPLPKNYQKVVSEFGHRINPINKKPKMHKGCDFRAPTGTPVIAPAAGTILSAQFDRNYGWNIIIKHDEHYQTRYAHLSEVLVKTGDIVEMDKVIGKVGNTGKSTGPHLHYEVIKDGEHVNPNAYFSIFKNL